MFSGKLEFQSPLRGTYLRDVLQQRARARRAGVEQSALHVPGQVANEDEYIEQMIASYKITIPSLNIGSIKKTDRYEDVAASRSDGGIVFPGQRSRVWVVTFNVPYEGDIELIQYVPGTGADMGWRPVVTVSSGCLVFQTQAPDGDAEQKAEAIRGQKNKVLEYLQQYIDSITPELVEFNQGVAADVKALYEAYKQKYRKDRDILAQL